MFATRHVSQVDADLTIVNLSQSSTPLPSHANGLGSLLGKGGWIEDQDGILLADFPCHLGAEFADEGLVIPIRLSDELLQSLSFAIVEVSDRLSILAFELGEESLDVLLSVGPLFGGAE
jgi:hypothetical protein